MLPRARHGALGAVLLALAWISCAPGQPVAQTATASRFAAEIAALSEPGGFFDTDNLISNERSYLHAVSDLDDARVHGGVYLGVGPEQNFSYIAAIRPDVAYLIDIRRDNLLLHLLFRAIFAESATRADYLSILFGRSRVTVPAGSDSIDTLVDRIDRAGPLAAAALEDLRRRLTTAIKASGVPLSAADLTTIDRFHRQFIDGGLSLQFHSTGRAPQFGYPTYRDLALEVDRQGRQRSFLTREEDFQFVRALEARDAVIPIVGDLSGATALAAVARTLAERQQRVTAFYASNVEFYLFRDGSFPRWMANLARLPRADNAVVIRSIFSGGGSPMPGYNSAQVTQSMSELVRGFGQGRYRNYSELTVSSRVGRTRLQR